MKTGINGKLSLIVLTGLVMMNAGCSSQLHTELMSSDDHLPWSLASLTSSGSEGAGLNATQSKTGDGLEENSSDQLSGSTMVSDYPVESPPLPRLGHSDLANGQASGEGRGVGDDSMFTGKDGDSHIASFEESVPFSSENFGSAGNVGGLPNQGRLFEGDSLASASDGFSSSTGNSSSDDLRPLDAQDLLTEMAAASGTGSGTGANSFSSGQNGTGLTPLGNELLGKGNIGDVFFDFDAATLRSDAESTLQVNAQILKASFGNREIVIEGHADERGTAEYNLILGERRAQSTKQYLVDLGVSSETIQTISYGKEKPFCTASQPDCWKKNRRGHFVLE